MEFWKEPSPVIAEVENTRLRVNDLQRMVHEGDSVPNDEWVRRIESWINMEIMYREAIKLGLEKDPETKKLIKDAQKKILVDKLRIALDSVVPTNSDKELLDYYERNKEVFRAGADSLPDSLAFVPFSDVQEQIQSALISEKRANREKRWLSEVKNSYSVNVYPQFLDSLL